MSLDPPIFDKGREEGIIYTVKSMNLPLREEQLDIADVVVSERIGIEIKRIKKVPPGQLPSNDLRASLFDGRLYSQSRELHKAYEIAYIVLEIEPDAKVYDSLFTQEHWENVHKTLVDRYDIHVKITHSMKETIDFIYEEWRREQEEHGLSARNKESSAQSLVDKQIFFLQGLLDVGYKASRELLAHFGSPIEVFKWIMERELKYTKSGNLKNEVDGSIPGFGPKFFIKNKTLILTDTRENNAPQ